MEASWPTQLKGANIICFAKDWNESPTSNNHIMNALARDNRVLWLNSISTRTPTLTSKRDLHKIFAKLGRFFRGAQSVAPNMWVYTPLVLPFPHSRIATMLNLVIMRFTFLMLRRKLKMSEFQLWTFLPNVANYIGKLGESLVVYYCVDEWSGFAYVDGPRIAAAEQLLCRRADAVFTVSRTLFEKKSAWNPSTFLAPHGVNHELFAGALDRTTSVPADLAILPQPVIGFYGTIQDWVDQELIAYLAERHPDWSIVLIGKVFVDVSCLTKFGNIHLLGPKPYTELSAYCKGFAVGIIPYRIDDRMLYVNPLKLQEYRSAGLPVVSTAIPEVVNHHSNHCTVAHTYEAFVQGVEEALLSDTPERRRERSETMRDASWTHVAKNVGAQIMRVKTDRGRQQ